MAGTRAAGLGLGSGLSAGAAASLAGDGRGNAQFRLAAPKGLLETDLQIVAQIRAARRAPPASSAAHDVAEQIVEHVGEGARESKALRALPPASVLECGMAVAVIGCAPVGVL